jgi:hypothetical protein
MTPERGLDLRQAVDLTAEDQAKEAMRRNQENAVTWRHHQLSTTLNEWTERFASRFLVPVLEPGKDGGLPSPIVGFEAFDHRIYAYYRLGKNAFGLEDEIILNEKHLGRPLYAVLETVLHEQIHLWQQRRGAHPVERNYHNQEFVSKAEQLGLHPQLVSGAHTRPADGQFERLLREYGIFEPGEEAVFPVERKDEKRNWWEDPGKERMGRSTLEKWSCGCGQNARIGAMAYFAVCVLCRQPFMPQREIAKWVFAEELMRLLGTEEEAGKRGLYEAYLARLTGADRVTPGERAAQCEVATQACAAHAMVGF